MRISNPKTSEFVENEACHGCMCHEMNMVFGNLESGCCDECGCPKNLKGFKAFQVRAAVPQGGDTPKGA